MKLKRTVSFLLLLCILFFFCSGEVFGISVPELTGRVVDRASMLSPTTVHELEKRLATFESEDSTQIAVLTIDSLQGENLEEFSLKIAEKWQLGQKGSDNGALLLIVKNDRKIRIEVGYGLEGTLTDLVAGRIIRDIITPQFRNSNFDKGVVGGVSAMIGAVRGEFDASAVASKTSNQSNDFTGFVIFALFAFFNLGRIFQKHKWIAAAMGSILGPVLGATLFGIGWPAFLLLIPAGMIAGLLLSGFGGNISSQQSTRSSTFGSGYSSGGFSSGGGGFSGGGGGFGGGGSSGGW